jgi:trehalose 6-phosphate synthase/phosphatase
MEGGKVKAYEQLLGVRRLLPEDVSLVIEDDFDINKLEEVSPTKTNDAVSQTTSMKSQASEADLDWKNLGERQSRLFLVCYHLPVDIRRTYRNSDPFIVTWSDSLIAKSEGSISHTLKTIWIGTVSISLNELTGEEKDYLVSLLQQMNCIPVFLDQDVAADAYHGFCKTVMWPVFHNVDQLDHIHAAWNLPPDYYDSQKLAQSTSSTISGNRSRSGSRVFDGGSSSKSENKVLEWNQQQTDFHAAFKKVNEVFADTIRTFTREGDIVWVHDYHLMLVPMFLRESVGFEQKVVKVIFFLHIPFPTSQIFRTLPEGNQLLYSMTCADLVGFHAFDHARHFLNAARRILGYRSNTRPGGMITLAVKDREVLVTMSHVSIETSSLDPVINDLETIQLANSLKEKYKGKKVILGIDVCQRLSGLALKMAAFEKFISDYGVADKGAVVLVQKCIRQGSRMEDEETTSNDMKRMVTAINSKYSHLVDGSVVVDYEELPCGQNLSLQQRIALYMVADVFLVTPIREGLNLLPLEYIYSRKDLARAGVVVASEFSTCSSLLNGSLKINPFAAASVADALEKALAMSPKDCEYRRQRDMPFITSHPSSKWTKRIVSELEQLQNNSGRARTKVLKLPEVLSSKLLVNAYQNSVRENDLIQKASRVFIFEYGGVLLQKEKFDIYIKQSLSAIAGRKPSGASYIFVIVY